jgi:serine/threonine protein phosphatase PrpC
VSADHTTKILVRTQAGARSECGPVRAMNEDAFAIDDTLGLYLVADGMGGHQAGEIAARIAADSVLGFLHRSREGGDVEDWPFGQDPAFSLEANRLRNAIELANRRVWRAAQSSRALDGMGTTVVAALVAGEQVVIGHVGDSRLYARSTAGLELLTMDDSWAVRVPGAQPVDADGRFRPGVLTSVLGVEESVTVHMAERPWAVGDVLVLCSDGLHGVLDGATLDQTLAAHPDPRAAARILVDLALERGSRDNITAVVVRRDQ